MSNKLAGEHTVGLPVHRPMVLDDSNSVRTGRTEDESRRAIDKQLAGYRKDDKMRKLKTNMVGVKRADEMTFNQKFCEYVAIQQELDRRSAANYEKLASVLNRYRASVPAVVDTLVKAGSVKAASADGVKTKLQDPTALAAIISPLVQSFAKAAAAGKANEPKAIGYGASMEKPAAAGASSGPIPQGSRYASQADIQLARRLGVSQ